MSANHKHTDETLRDDTARALSHGHPGRPCQEAEARSEGVPAPQWEPVIDSGAEVTERLRVPGGWLYKVQLSANSSVADFIATVALAFVPDPRA